VVLRLGHTANPIMVTLSFGLMDQYDIEESFEALDKDKFGRLSIDDAYILLLGLGYLKDYKQKDNFTPSDLKHSVRRVVQGQMDEDGTGERVSLKSLMHVVEKVRFLHVVNKINPQVHFERRCTLRLNIAADGYCSNISNHMLRQSSPSCYREIGLPI
jgi:hypothetical protein